MPTATSPGSVSGPANWPYSACSRVIRAIPSGPRPGQHPALLVLHLDVVMIFSPVIADEQHTSLPSIHHIN